MRRLDDKVIQTVFLVAQSLCFFPGRQIIRQHEIPALDDIEHSFFPTPCSEAGIIRQKNYVVNPSTGGENEHRERAPRSRSPRAITARSSGMSAPGVSGDGVSPQSTRLAQPSQGQFADAAQRGSVGDWGSLTGSTSARFTTM